MHEHEQGRGPALDGRAEEIGGRVRAFIDDPAADDFDRLARDVFDYQLERNPAYRAYCDRRGVSGAVGSWRDIPPLPVRAFKEVSLTCGAPALTFRTSGTTSGAEGRGEHGVVDPSLYAHALRRGFREFVLPDRERIRVLSLVPPVSRRADSSLSHMAAVILDAFGDRESETYVGSNDLLLGAFFAALDRASQQGVPVLVFTTTLALVPVLDAARAEGHAFRLPAGSRLVDTGGTKGHGREFNEKALLEGYEDVLGIPPAACINEYGMTELLSQYYNDDLLAHLRGEPRSDVDRARKRAPHWLRARVLDPDTMTDADHGLLAHVDLANCHSVVSVVTDDVGARIDDDTVRLEGRRPGAAARGCSIAMDEWLQ